MVQVEKCSKCQHGWHGLTCQQENTVLDENKRFAYKEPCGCPSQFALLEEEKKFFSSTKGSW